MHLFSLRLRLKGAAVAFLAASTTALVNADDAVNPLSVVFVNNSPTQAIDLYWENHSHTDDHPGRRQLEVRIPPRGGWYRSTTFTGHEFSYEMDGERHYVNPGPGNAHGEQFLVLAGKSEGYRVRCVVTVNRLQVMEFLDILVKPYWAPRGAARFLELVRAKYYDGVVFNRVVPNLLAQFGIAKDYATRTKERELTIWDDFPTETPFEPGVMSFAGSGPDSRTTEIFVVMPGAPKEQIEKYGTNSWEVPFAVIDGDVNTSALKEIFSGYGDTNGPDTSKIYEDDGYTTYLPKEFPQLDYIDNCYIVDELGISDDHPGQEL